MKIEMSELDAYHPESIVQPSEKLQLTELPINLLILNTYPMEQPTVITSGLATLRICNTLLSIVDLDSHIYNFSTLPYYFYPHSSLIQSQNEDSTPSDSQLTQLFLDRIREEQLYRQSDLCTICYLQQPLPLPFHFIYDRSIVSYPKH